MTKFTKLPLAAIITGMLSAAAAGPAFAQNANVPEKLDEILEILNAQQNAIDDLQDTVDELQDAADESDRLLEPKTIFVSSTLHTGNLNGLAGADAICQGLADAPGSIVPEGEYVALLSTRNINGAQRLTPSSGPYLRSDGAIVAASYAALFSTRNVASPAHDLVTTVNRDELGDSQNNEVVWTSTTRNGINPTNTCDDWTLADQSLIPATGNTSQTDEGWIDFSGRSCDTSARLYCVQR